MLFRIVHRIMNIGYGNNFEVSAVPGTSQKQKPNGLSGFEEFFKKKMAPNCNLEISTENIDGSTEGETTDEDEEGIIAVHMDVQYPLEHLRRLLESKTGRTLVGFPFTLQKSQVLDSTKNLVEQCVEGEGCVQVNVKIEDDPSLPIQSIDILDVLKPAEVVRDDGINNQVTVSDKRDQAKMGDPNNCSNAEFCSWIADAQYRKNQIRLGIPMDPSEWSEAHVRHWVVWAVRKFDLSQVKLAEWRGVDGKKLVAMKKDEFLSRVPCDPGQTFWMHFLVLVRCHLVAVPKTISEDISSKPRSLSPVPSSSLYLTPSTSSAGPPASSVPSHSSSPPASSPSNPSPPSHSSQTGMTEIQNPSQPPSRLRKNNYKEAPDMSGCQLWQFLLELLTDRRYSNVISWLPREGEFLLLKPEVIASLWGKRKGRKNMSYEKLARALRCYYESADRILAKVPGQKYVYKFVCDLKFLIGYTSLELRQFVNEKYPKRETAVISPVVFQNGGS